MNDEKTWEDIVDEGGLHFQGHPPRIDCRTEQTLWGANGATLFESTATLCYLRLLGIHIQRSDYFEEDIQAQKACRWARAIVDEIARQRHQRRMERATKTTKKPQDVEYPSREGTPMGREGLPK